MRHKEETLKEYGLIGYPLGHSFSVAYFTEKFEREGIAARYRNFPIKMAEELVDLLKRKPGLRGLNVTVPHKQAVMEFLDRVDPEAAEVAAVNTLLIGKDGSLSGYNTDVIGFGKSLGEHLKVLPERALVLGTGGSSKAVRHVLGKLGVGITMVSRSPGEGRLCYEEVTEEVLSGHLLVVNTTPLGMSPRVDAAPSLPYSALGRYHLLFDLIYNPPMTRFLELGKEQGCRVINGHDMLRYQAEASWEIWTRKGDI